MVQTMNKIEYSSFEPVTETGDALTGSGVDADHGKTKVGVISLFAGICRAALRTRFTETFEVCSKC